MPEPRKQEIITFKVDEALRRALQGVQNRSEFIRAAILAALDSVCPLCKGSGILTPDQRKHWETFSKNHPLHQCEDCHAVHLICGAETREEREEGRRGEGEKGRKGEREKGRRGEPRRSLDLRGEVAGGGGP